MVPIAQALMLNPAAFNAWMQKAWTSDNVALSTEMQLRDGRTMQLGYIH